MDGTEGGGSAGASEAVSTGASLPSSGGVTTQATSHVSESQPIQSAAPERNSTSLAREAKAAQSKANAEAAVRRFQESRNGSGEAARPQAKPIADPNAEAAAKAQASPVAGQPAPGQTATPVAPAAVEPPVATPQELATWSRALGLDEATQKELGPKAIKVLAIREGQRLYAEKQAKLAAAAARPAPVLPDFPADVYEPQMQQLRDYITHQDTRFQQLEAQFAERYTKLENVLRGVEGHFRQEQERLTHIAMHDQLSDLDPDIFGAKGKELNEPRQKVWDYVHAIQIGMEAQGKKAPEFVELAKQARLALFGEQVQKNQREKLSQQSQRMRLQVTSPPTSQDHKLPNQTTRAEQAVRDWQNKRLAAMAAN